MILAQAAELPPEGHQWLDWIDRLGTPGVLVIFLFWTLSRFVKWAGPRLDRMIDAHVERQREVGAAMVKLTEKTIEIQQANSETLKKIELGQPMICRYRARTS